jgi:hypothetical protein
MLADRILRHHRLRSPPADALVAAAMAPLSRLCALIRRARRLEASSGFIAAAEALGHLRYEPLVRRLRGARLAADLTWLEFAAEEKEAVRTRLYAERGMPLAPRAPDAPAPVALGYLMMSDPATRAVAVSLVAELVDREQRAGLSICPYELVLDLSPVAAVGAEPPPAAPPPDAHRSIAATRLDERPDEAASLAELDARMGLRPLSWAPRVADRLAKVAPEVPAEAWWRDLATEAASIAASVGILANPSGLVFSSLSPGPAPEPAEPGALAFQRVGLSDALPEA